MDALALDAALELRFGVSNADCGWHGKLFRDRKSLFNCGLFSLVGGIRSIGFVANPIACAAGKPYVKIT
jgi:hypothetical protein